jgi:uncharacterized protein YktA (UPF0223 family)
MGCDIMGIWDIHSDAFNLFQEIITDKNHNKKTCIITFPNDAIFTAYRGKSFVLECNTSSIENDRTKSDDTTYNSEAIKITLLISDLETSYDTKNQIKSILNGFKQNSVIVKYNSNRYVIKEEVVNPFKTTISLYCDLSV